MDLPSPKINFDDINKFEASWGVFLLILSAASFVFEDEFKIVPMWIRIIVVGIALIAIIRGLCKWRQRQTLLDENLDLDNKEKRQKLQDANRKENSIVKEMIEQTRITQNVVVENQQPNAGIAEKNEDVGKKYREITHNMFQQLYNISNPDYVVLKNKSINNIIFYDLIYQSQKKGVNDKVVEVRYITELRDSINITGLLNDLYIQISMYRRDIKQTTDLILVIIYNEKSVSTEQLRNKIKQHITNNDALHGMQLYFVQEKEIDKFDADILLV